MTVIGLFFKRLKLMPHFLLLVAIDFVRWIISRGWTIFDDWGLHIYVGKFGAGKTSSMVREAYKICCRYSGMTVLTNVNIKNFPEDTKIIYPLKSARQIIDAPDNTIVVIDEIGTIFNSRDWSNSKGGGVPKALFQHICQCRHRHMKILATTQDWMFMDKQLRQITADVTVCSSAFAHPFSRMVTNRVYDAREYTMFFENPLLPLTALYIDCYVQTDKLRSLYDTKEMVETLLTMDYIPDSEILANQTGEPAAPSQIPADKKKQLELIKKMKKGGL